MKKVIYTCIFGDYDDLKEPKVITEGWTYICFTDQNFKSDVWEVVKIDSLDNKMECRKLWIYPYDYLRGFDIALSVAGAIFIECNLDDYIKANYEETKLSLLGHNDRSCVYEEGVACIKLNKDTVKNVINSINYYKAKGMPKDFGLWATGVTIRNLNNTEVKAFCKYWLTEQKKFSHRDQLSLAYSVWSLDFKSKIKNMNWNDILGSHFSYTKHKS